MLFKLTQNLTIKYEFKYSKPLFKIKQTQHSLKTAKIFFKIKQTFAIKINIRLILI